MSKSYYAKNIFVEKSHYDIVFFFHMTHNRYNKPRHVLFCFTLGTDHLTSREGYVFFCFFLNILIPNVAEKNIPILVEEKK
jgi:hypothetical protein